MTERTYDYTAKNVVRGLWMQFLPTYAKTPNASGLYLPAPENLELPGYLEKGIAPEQLVGCENDERFQPAVHAAGGGIRVVEGSITDGVNLIEALGLPRINFANLDFDGMYDTYVSEILSVFRVFPGEADGYLAVTSYSARDDECLKQGNVNLSKFYSGLDRPSFMADVGKMLSRWRRSRRDLKSRVPDHHYLSREIGLLWWIAVASALVSYQGQKYGTIAQTQLSRLEKVLSKLTENAVGRSRGTDFNLVHNEQLAGLLRRSHVELWPTDLRHILYYSHRSQPMRTWFFRICQIPAEERITAQELLAQYWELATRAPLLVIDEDGTRTTYE